MAVVQGGFEFRLGFEAVAGIEQRREVRVNAFERAEIAIQKLADHLAKPGIVLREAGGIDGVAAFTSGDDSVKQIHLRALAAAIDAFDGNEPAVGPSVYIRTQINPRFQDNSSPLRTAGQSNRRHSALQCRAC